VGGRGTTGEETFGEEGDVTLGVIGGTVGVEDSVLGAVLGVEALAGVRGNVLSVP
jgi:hypothetical protein